MNFCTTLEVKCVFQIPEWLMDLPSLRTLSLTLHNVKNFLTWFASLPLRHLYIDEDTGVNYYALMKPTAQREDVTVD